jgi:alpha-methylacyl-CoA racemase
MQPLAGIKVVDFSTLLPGPLASLILAEAGAEVIKIERPGKATSCAVTSPGSARPASVFALRNRGKRSIALDLKAAGAKARLMPLLGAADVLIERLAGQLPLCRPSRIGADDQ